MNEEEDKISCPIFQKQEAIIKSINGKINAAGGVQEKAIFAEELQKEVNVLLNCQDYNCENPACKNCRYIANLRRETANLIIKAKKLTKKGG